MDVSIVMHIIGAGAVVALLIGLGLKLRELQAVREQAQIAARDAMAQRVQRANEELRFNTLLRKEREDNARTSKAMRAGEQARAVSLESALRRIILVTKGSSTDTYRNTWISEYARAALGQEPFDKPQPQNRSKRKVDLRDVFKKANAYDSVMERMRDLQSAHGKLKTELRCNQQVEKGLRNQLSESLKRQEALEAQRYMVTPCSVTADFSHFSKITEELQCSQFGIVPMQPSVEVLDPRDDEGFLPWTDYDRVHLAVQPVANGVPITVKLRDGEVLEDERPEHLGWGSQSPNTEDDIVGWKFTGGRYEPGR